jgi:hypothetical protein
MNLSDNETGTQAVLQLIYVHEGDTAHVQILVTNPFLLSFIYSPFLTSCEISKTSFGGKRQHLEVRDRILGED